MNKTRLVAYHNDSALKAALLVEIAKHEAADAIAQGLYSQWDPTNAMNFRGCAIGCSLHALNTVQGHPEYQANRFDAHERYPLELGIPIELAHLEDYIFESLAIGEARQWPRRFAEAVPVGVDLS